MKFIVVKQIDLFFFKLRVYLKLLPENRAPYSMSSTKSWGFSMSSATKFIYFSEARKHIKQKNCFIQSI